MRRYECFSSATPRPLLPETHNVRFGTAQRAAYPFGYNSNNWRLACTANVDGAARLARKLVAQGLSDPDITRRLS